MKVDEIDGIFAIFVHGPNVAIAASFSLVRNHGAHCLLVSQFLILHNFTPKILWRRTKAEKSKKISNKPAGL